MPFEEEEGYFERNPAGTFVRVEEVTVEDLYRPVKLVVDGRWVTVPLAVPVVDELRAPKYDGGNLVVRQTTLYDAISIRYHAAVYPLPEKPKKGTDLQPVPHGKHNTTPTLCHQQHVQPIGVCRVCSVLTGKRTVSRDVGWTVTAFGASIRIKKTTFALEEKFAAACIFPVPEPKDGETLCVFTHRAGEALPEVEEPSIDPVECAERVRRHVQTLLRLLANNHLPNAPPELTDPPDHRYDNELLLLCRSSGFEEVKERRTCVPLPVLGAGTLVRRDDRDAAGRAAPLVAVGPGDCIRDARVAAGDVTSPIIVVDRNNCILCDRCVRACSEVKPFKIIGHTGFGVRTGITFDLNHAMGFSGCVACGECAVACPTGALTFNPKKDVHRDEDEKDPAKWRSAASTPWTGQEFEFPRVTVAAATGGASDTITPSDVPPISPKTVFTLDLTTPGHPDGGAAALFEDVPYAFLRWNQGAVGVLDCADSDVRLCEEGQYGSVAFIPLEGKISVFRGNATGGFQFIADEGPAAPTPPVGGITVLGEMACLTGQPRRATLVARKGARVLVVNRNVLHVLQRSWRGHNLLAPEYRRRALENYFHSCDMFPKRDQEKRDEWVAALREHEHGGHVEFRRYRPGQAIVKQGDRTGHDHPDNGFYVLYTGHAQVSVADPASGGRVRVLNYLSAGQSFGEIALLSAMDPGFRAARPDAPRGERTATVTALDHVDVVRVGTVAFEDLVRRFDWFRRDAEDRGRRQFAQSGTNTADHSRRYQELLQGQGLYQGQSLLVLDLNKCTRCQECVKACADSHHGDTRLYLEGNRFEQFLIPSACRSCYDPECLVGCPVDAIHRKPDREGRGLAIRIEPNCIGCGLCAHNCPFGSIHMLGAADAAYDLKRQLSQKKQARMATNCDLCETLDGNPRCVQHCPHDAAHRFTGNQLARFVGLVPTAEDTLPSSTDRARTTPPS
jgi:Fe-S-cluster-containing hydrogenase component 2/CRP-like cAMP-binding protein